MSKIANGIMKLNSKLVEVFLPLTNKNVVIGNGLRLRRNVVINCNGGKLVIGKGAFINSNCSINTRELIIIGDNFLAGENVHIYDHNHIYKDSTIPVSQQGFTCKPVKIGNNVWIGSNVTILAGVSVGDNVVIGANCLIYKDIPANMIVKCNQELIITERCVLE